MSGGAVPSSRLLSAAGLLVAVGALFMVAKGAARIATGADPSLVPFFGAFVCAGLTAAAVALRSPARRLRWASGVAAVAAVVGVAASVVALRYLAAGTIPETPGAPPVVGGSYALLTAGAFLALLALGTVIAVNRALPRWWRWLPLGVITAQFPVFAIAGAAGDVAGSEVVADGLGLAITGLAWMLLGYGLTLGRGATER